MQLLQQALGKLTINSANNVQTKAITAADITQTVSATGAVTVSGDLTATNGDIFFINPVTLNNVSTNNVSLTAHNPTSINPLQTGRITLNNGFVAGSNNLTLTADEIDIVGPPSSGTGDLVLQPFVPGLNIALGDTIDRPASLDMTGLFNRLQDGFKSIAIGRTDSTGAITIESPLTFRDPVTIRSPLGAGSIAILPTGSLTGTDNASITLTANQKITAGNITTTGTGDITLTSNIGTIALNGPIATSDKNITFNGPVTLQNNVLLDTGTAGTGNILFSNTVNSTTVNNQNLTLTAGTGNITFNGDVGNQSAIGNLQINNATDVQTATITANSINLTATGKTTLNGAVKTNGAGGINLNVTNLAIDFPVTTGNNGTFTVNHSGDLNIATGANLVLDGAFTESGTGNVNIASNITTTNDNITLNNPVILTNNVALNTGAGNGNITFNKTVDGTTPYSQNLTLTAGTGNITFKGDVGNPTIAIGNLQINSATDVTTAAITANSITQSAGTGTTAFNGPVKTNVADGINLTGTNFAINNRVTTLNSGIFTVNNSGVLNIAPGASLALDGSFIQSGTGNVNIMIPNITTTKGKITFIGPVSLKNNVSFNTGNSDIVFKNTVDGTTANSQNLTLTAGSGKVTFTGAAGNTTTPLGAIIANTTGTTSFASVNAQSLTTDAGGTTQLNGNVTTTGAQSYADAVTIANNPILIGNGITFDNTVNGNSNLTVNGGTGNITFTGAIGNPQKLLGAVIANTKGTTNFGSTVNAQSLTTYGSGGTTQLTGDVTTTNSQTYGNAVTIIPKNLTLAGNGITFDSTVNGNSDLTVNGGTGTVTFTGTVGNSTNLLGAIIANTSGTTSFASVNSQSLTTDAKGTTQLNGNVTTTSTQTYGDAVTIANNPILKGNGITFDNTVNGNSNLTVNGGTGNVTFTGAVGNSSSLANLVVQANGNVTANSTINTQNLAVSSSGGNINFLGDATAYNSGNGGSIALLSPVGTVNVKNLTTSGNIGGYITVVAQTSITAGQINSSGSVGNGGNVFLDPIGDVQVGFINAQGGTSGNGGTVFVSSTGGFFRATDSFPTLLSPGVASISTAGGTGGGNITIQHAGGDGGPPIQPFVVGDATLNGTKAAISTGQPQSTIQSQSFPRSRSFGNIAFSTDDGIDPITPTPTPSVIPTPSPTPTPVVIPTPSPTPTPIATQPIDLMEIQTPIAPVTTTSPAATPAPKRESSTLDAEGSRRKIPPLDNPGVANQVLTLDQSITSQLPPNYLKPQENPQPSSILNPASDRLLGYVPSPDRLFEENNLEKTIWGIEKTRNQEFSAYLGVKTNLPDENVLINQFQQTLRTIEQKTGKRSGIIYLVSRDEQLEIILVPPVGQPIRYSVPEANRAALFPAVKELRDEITIPRNLNTTTYLPAAQQLYKWSFARLEPDLERLGIRTLLLSVDPGLRSLPFAALHDGKGFLIEKYNFSLIPSFSTTNTDYQSVIGATVLAMGRSEFIEQKPLPSVPLELQRISAEWQGPSFLNSTFTIDNLNSQHAQRGFRIVHLATHAEFQPGKPSNSYIQLWNAKLPLDRLESLNWRNPQVELLVLSACRTALGDRDAELGFGGLAVKSGAKSALGSLWYVDDGGTLALMSEFYGQLRGATIKTEALQLAQQAMIAGKIRIENGQLVTTARNSTLPTNLKLENHNFSHPYYWSSFTMIGNPW